MSLPEVPETALDHPELAADWAELCVLLSSVGELSKEEALGVVEDLVGGGMEMDIGTDKLETLMEDVWGSLFKRQGDLGEAYPFSVAPGMLTRSVESWTNVPAYLLLLILDLGRAYGETKPLVLPAHGSIHRLLFEKVVTASVAGLYGRPAIRFGWPLERHWPRPIEERLSRVADILELSLDSLEGKVQPTDKDRGVDVIVRAIHGDRDDGGLLLLVQCATGKNWQEKNAEPNLELWKNLLLWQSSLLRAIAIPWRLGGEEWSYWRTWRHFVGALVFDRPRLLKGHPDRLLSDGDREKIERWCIPILSKIPLVA